jgi:hypothetical protein
MTSASPHRIAHRVPTPGSAAIVAVAAATFGLRRTRQPDA